MDVTDGTFVLSDDRAQLLAHGTFVLSDDRAQLIAHDVQDLNRVADAVRDLPYGARLAEKIREVAYDLDYVLGLGTGS